MEDRAPSAEFQLSISATLARLASTWDSPSVERFPVVINARMKTSLARCRPASGHISLSIRLFQDLPRLLEEAICHEAAHIIAYQLYGRRIRPHGFEWQALIRQAGFEPRRMITGIPPDGRTKAGQRNRYEHRCPVCQSVRFAGRRMHHWRCFPCRDEGFEGELVISQTGARANSHE